MAVRYHIDKSLEMAIGSRMQLQFWETLSRTDAPFKKARHESVLRVSASPRLRVLLFALINILLAAPLLFASSSTALKRYEAGKYESALREYKRLLLDKPDDARLHFNAGAAAFRVNDFDEALKHLNSSLVTQDLQLQERAYYNLGNTEYRRGAEEHAPDKKKTDWEQSIANYESALKLNAKDEDARFNLEL